MSTTLQTDRPRTATTPRVAAGLMASAAALAIAGFTALGAVFEYPQILGEPTAEILDLYRAHAGAVTGWFLVLCLSAGLLAPVGLLLGRAAGGRLGAAIAVTGTLAAAVQVTGLSRWVLLVPGIAREATDPDRAAAAHARLETLHFWLGTVVGETVGYALTATFTVAAAISLARAGMPRTLALLGHGSAMLIATGVLLPLADQVPALHAASLTNFAGYVGWCLWLIAVAGWLWRRTGAGLRAPSTA